MRARRIGHDVLGVGPYKGAMWLQLFPIPRNAAEFGYAEGASGASRSFAYGPGLEPIFGMSEEILMKQSTTFVSAVSSLLVIAITVDSPAIAHDFTWDNLALACIKLDKNYDVDANVEWYMQKYRSDTWNHSRNDEFLFHEKKEETRKLFQERIDQFNVGETFVLRADMTIGNYDFTNEEFPREPSGPDSYWYKTSSKYSDSIPYRLKVFMKNHEFLEAVPMDANTARAFIQSRKNRNGYVDRHVYGLVEFRLIKLKGEGELLAEALKVTYFRDSARRQPIGPTRIWKPKTERASTDSVAPSDATEKQERNADLGVVGRR